MSRIKLHLEPNGDGTVKISAKIGDGDIVICDSILPDDVDTLNLIDLVREATANAN